MYHTSGTIDTIPELKSTKIQNSKSDKTRGSNYQNCSGNNSAKNAVQIQPVACCMEPTRESSDQSILSIIFFDLFNPLNIRKLRITTANQNHCFDHPASTMCRSQPRCRYDLTSANAPEQQDITGSGEATNGPHSPTFVRMLPRMPPWGADGSQHTTQYHRKVLSKSYANPVRLSDLCSVAEEDF